MIQTIVKEAAVYRSGCVVKRQTVLPLQAGRQTVTFPEMSPGMDQNSLRLLVPAGVQGSNVQVEFLTREQQQEAVRDLKQQVGRLTARMNSIEKQIELWTANADFSQKESLSIGEMAEYLEQLPGRLEELEETRQAIEEEKNRLQKEVNEAAEKARRPYISAELTAEADGSYPIELVYQDHQAYWYPSYEIHAEDDQDSLLLRLRARVSQNTPEDWSGVKIRLFSGNPSVSGTIPELPATHIGFYEAPKYRSVGAARSALSFAKAAVRDDAVAMEEAEATVEAPAMALGAAMNTVTVGAGTASQGETMTEYELEGVWDIRKGQEILCDIRDRSIPCRFQVVAVPKSSDSAYLAAEVDTAELEEMQGTPAAVYLNGTFAGNVVLNPDMTEEKYRLSLGVDETVRVKRTQKKKYTSQVLLKGQKKTEYEYEISAVSRKPRTIDLVLKDQIPVSDEKNIIVERGQLASAKLEEETGILTWQFPLNEGESRTVGFGYSVAWPKDKTITETYR